jgi:hypothetical protein
MPRWLRRNPEKAKRLSVRVVDVLEELGTLLIAFAPLDAAIEKANLRDAGGFLALFLGAGIVSLGVAWWIDWRRDNAN